MVQNQQLRENWYCSLTIIFITNQVTTIQRNIINT